MTNWSNQTATATSWTKQGTSSTSFNGRDLVNLGVIMDDTVYTMDSAVATMDDMKLSPILAPSSSWSGIATNPSMMYGRYAPILFALGDDTVYLGDDSLLTGDDTKLNNIYSPATLWANQ